MSNIYQKTCFVVLLITLSMTPVLSQSLLFRVPYFSWDSPNFNPATNGKTGSLRGQYMLGRTVLPDNELHTFALDGQVKFKKREYQLFKFMKAESYPRLFPTWGITAMRYREGGEYAFHEMTGNVGLRIGVPNKSERTWAGRRGHLYSATEYNSKLFLAGSYSRTIVNVDLFENDLVFNSGINFDPDNNGFDDLQGRSVPGETAGVSGLGLLLFWSIMDPMFNKPDGKPVVYVQAGYRETFKPLNTLLIDYNKLQVIHTDLHFMLPLGKVVKNLNTLSMTLSYLYLDQNQEDGLSFNQTFSQNRFVATLHYFNERQIGFDIGTEVDKQQLSVFAAGKFRKYQVQYTFYGSIGFISDQFDDIVFRGINGTENFKFGLSMEFFGKKDKNPFGKSNDKGGSQGRAGQN